MNRSTGFVLFTMGAAILASLVTAWMAVALRPAPPAGNTIPLPAIAEAAGMFLPFGLLLGGIGAWIGARAVKRSERSRSFGVWVIHGGLCGLLLGASPLLMLAPSGLDRGVLGLVAYGGMVPGALVGAAA